MNMYCLIIVGERVYEWEHREQERSMSLSYSETSGLIDMQENT